MWLKKRTHGFEGVHFGPCRWKLERSVFALILTGVFVASTTLFGCIQPDLPAAKVQGVVVDATTFVPLAGVQVRSRDASTISDMNGRYQLLVSQGVRELTYSMSDHSPIRKYVVVEEKGDIQLDTLYPASGEVPKGKLVLSRGLAVNKNGADIHRDAGETHLVSICDEFGNQEFFPFSDMVAIRSFHPYGLHRANLSITL
jgi:hypothetical protein